MTPVRSALIVWLAVGSALRAESPPAESLLPATTQLYIRWDGIDVHRREYAQTTLGRLLASDLAPLLKTALDFYPKSLQAEFVDQKLLSGAAPAKLAGVQEHVRQAGRLPEILARHGIIVAGEVGPMPNIWAIGLGAVKQAAGQASDRNLLMPPIDLTIVVPDAASDRAALEAIVRLQAESIGSTVKESTIGDHRVVHGQIGPMHWAIFDHAGHAAVALSTEPPERIIARATTKQGRLNEHALYARLAGVHEFRTDVRAFVDLRSLMKTARQAINFANLFARGLAQKFDEFGLDSFDSLIYLNGFDGEIRREVVEVDFGQDRRGVGKLLGGTPLRWDELPPFPADVAKWSAHRIDLAMAYDLAVKYIDLAKPRDDESDKESAAVVIDQALGLDLKNEVFGQLKDVTATWSSPSEGAIMLGQVVAVQVKDAARIAAALEQIEQNTVAASNLRLKKQPCLDATIHQFQAQNRPGFVIVPSFVVYKNWLAVAFYPQPLQAFVRRLAGESPAWRPDAATREQFAKLPEACSAWAFNDMRPAVQQLLTFAPLIIEASQSFGSGNGFDVGMLPSGSMILPKLRPNVTGMTDHGRRLRWETRGGILIPGDSLGIDPMMLFLGAQILF